MHTRLQRQESKLGKWSFPFVNCSWGCIWDSFNFWSSLVMRDINILSWVLQEDQVSEIEREAEGPEFVWPREEKVVGDLIAISDYRRRYEKARHSIKVQIERMRGNEHRLQQKKFQLDLTHTHKIPSAEPRRVAQSWDFRTHLNMSNLI